MLVSMLAKNVFAAPVAAIAIVSGAGCSMSEYDRLPARRHERDDHSVTSGATAAHSDAGGRRGSGREPITEAAIRAHMEFLASDALNGRGSGTRDEWIAATYIASQFRLWGLEPMGDDGGFVQQIEMAGAQATARADAAHRRAPDVHARQGNARRDAVGASASGPHRQVPRRRRRSRPAPSSCCRRASAAGAVTAASLILRPRDAAGARAVGRARGAAMPTIAARAVKLAAPRQPGRRSIYLDKAAYAAVAARCQTARRVAFAADVKPTTPTYTWNTVAPADRHRSGRCRSRSSCSARTWITSARGRPAGHRHDLQRRRRRRVRDGGGDDAGRSAREGTASEANDRLRAVRQRGARRLRRGLLRRSAGGAARPSWWRTCSSRCSGAPIRRYRPNTLWLTGYERSNLGAELARQGARLVADPHPEQSFFTRSDNIRFARRGVVAHTVSSYNLHKEYHQPSDEVRKIDFAHMTDVDSIDARTGTLAGELGLQTGVGTGRLSGAV